MSRRLALSLRNLTTNTNKRSGGEERLLVLLRHGESIWNRENRFTGWSDVPLTSLGEEEATEAGEILAAVRF